MTIMFFFSKDYFSCLNYSYRLGLSKENDFCMNVLTAMQSDRPSFAPPSNKHASHKCFGKIRTAIFNWYCPLATFQCMDMTRVSICISTKSRYVDCSVCLIWVKEKSVTIDLLRSLKVNEWCICRAYRQQSVMQIPSSSKHITVLWATSLLFKCTFPGCFESAWAGGNIIFWNSLFCYKYFTLTSA